MSTSGGPRILSDNLVLCLDAHDAKSYAGEPTTNLSANSDYSGVTLDSINSSSNGGWGSTFDRWVSLIEGPAGKKVRAFHLKLTGTTSGAHAEGAPYNLSGMDSQYGTLTAGSTYTSSVWAKVIRANGSTTPHTESNLMYLVGQQNVSSPTQTVNTEWTKISCARTIAAGQTGDYRLRHYFYSAGVGDTLVIAEPQIELKGYATPYVYSSRAYNTSWQDRVSSNYAAFYNEALTRTGHYRDGQVILPINSSHLDFDGSNDMVTFSNDAGLFRYTPSGSTYNNSLTIEAWFRINNNDSGNIISYPWNGNGEYNWRLLDTSVIFSGAGSVSISGVNDGNWHQLVATATSTTVKAYIDGSLSGTTNHTSEYTGPTHGVTAHSFAIMTLYPYGTWAAGNTGFSTDGQFAIARIYNTELSAAEIKQNFNAQRGRFGI